MFLRSIAVGMIVMFALGGVVVAQEAPASGPHTVYAPPRVVVFPFAPTGDVGADSWIGQAIQQSLLVQMSGSGTVANSVPTTQPSAPADPIGEGTRAGANVVVFGNFQIINGEIRCTGQVVETSTNHALGTLSATGSLRDLFQLEDSLGNQLRSALAQEPGYQSDESALAPMQTPSYDPGYATIHYPSPSEDYSTPDYYPDYSGYGYGPYYGVPFYGGFFLSSGRFGFRDFHNHFHHDGRFDHHFGQPFSHDRGQFFNGSNGFQRGNPSVPGRPFMGGGRPFSGMSGAIHGGTVSHR
jgi:TolB-like protein